MAQKGFFHPEDRPGRTPEEWEQRKYKFIVGGILTFGVLVFLILMYL